jgi:hypothetical protein
MNAHSGFRLLLGSTVALSRYQNICNGCGWNKHLFIILYVMKRMDFIMVAILTLVVALLVAAYNLITALR